MIDAALILLIGWIWGFITWWLLFKGPDAGMKLLNWLRRRKR